MRTACSLALRFRLHHAHAADLGGAGDVGPAVRLAVEADDVDDSDLRDVRRNHVHLGADELGIGLGGGVGEELDADHPIGCQLLVHQCFDLGRESLGQRSNSKSMRAASGSMFPPVTATCQRFQITRTGRAALSAAHEPVPALPVDLPAHRRPEHRTSPSIVCQTSSPSLRTSVTALRRACGVVWLPAAGGVERGAVEGDALPVDRRHHGVEGPQLRVPEVEELGGHVRVLLGRPNVSRRRGRSQRVASFVPRDREPPSPQCPHGRNDVLREPPLGRPALVALLAGTAVLYLWGLGASGWANSFSPPRCRPAPRAGRRSSSDPRTPRTSSRSTSRRPRCGSWSSRARVRCERVEHPRPAGAGRRGRRRLRLCRGPPLVPSGRGAVGGAVVATTPAAALMFRFNNPDALLVMLLCAAAYAMTRAIENGATKWIVLCFSARRVRVPGQDAPGADRGARLGFAYLLAGPPRLGRRVAQLAIGAVALVVPGAGGWRSWS